MSKLVPDSMKALVPARSGQGRLQFTVYQSQLEAADMTMRQYIASKLGRALQPRDKIELYRKNPMITYVTVDYEGGVPTLPASSASRPASKTPVRERHILGVRRLHIS